MWLFSLREKPTELKNIQPRYYAKALLPECLPVYLDLGQRISASSRLSLHLDFNPRIFHTRIRELMFLNKVTLRVDTEFGVQNFLDYCADLHELELDILEIETNFDFLDCKNLFYSLRVLKITVKKTVQGNFLALRERIRSFTNLETLDIKVEFSEPSRPVHLFDPSLSELEIICIDINSMTLDSLKPSRKYNPLLQLSVDWKNDCLSTMEMLSNPSSCCMLNNKTKLNFLKLRAIRNADQWRILSDNVIEELDVVEPVFFALKSINATQLGQSLERLTLNIDATIMKGVKLEFPNLKFLNLTISSSPQEGIVDGKKFDTDFDRFVSKNFLNDLNHSLKVFSLQCPETLDISILKKVKFAVLEEMMVRGEGKSWAKVHSF